MSYLEELLPELRNGAKIRQKHWEDGAYIEKCAQGIIYHNIKEHDVDILADDYELYKEPEPYWDYIINNKCLCWFFDDNENGKYLGTIRFINKNDELPFMNWERGYAKYCRPVRRDEVTFYEDRKDE